VDIRRPYTGEEEQSDVGEVVHRKEEESYQIGGSLHQTVDGVEGDGCPGSQRRGGVVLMVQAMDIFVAKLVGMKSSMYPVDTDFNECYVEEEI
jgi:hypothetical protein